MVTLEASYWRLALLSKYYDILIDPPRNLQANARSGRGFATAIIISNWSCSALQVTNTQDQIIVTEMVWTRVCCSRRRRRGELLGVPVCGSTRRSGKLAGIIQGCNLIDFDPLATILLSTYSEVP